MLQVVKRNGILVPFDKQRIINAVNAAFCEVDGELYETDTANDIADDIYVWAAYDNADKQLTVEDIQNKVEELLMRSERRDVAREYIRYRYKREIARKGNDDFVKGYSEKINAANPDMQNANVDEFSFGGRVGAGSDYMMKKYALDYCVSKMARENHLNNEIYIHDLSAYAVGMHNCLSIPFDKLLAEGFNTRQTDVRPAGSVNTAMQLVAVLFQLQSLQQFGGVSATHLDWTMVPYVRKSFWKHYSEGIKYLSEFDETWRLKDIDITKLPIEPYDNPTVDQDAMSVFYMLATETSVMKYALDMTEKEIHQAVEGLYHNLR